MHAFFLTFISSHWFHRDLYNYFATAFPQFLFCFSFEINLTNIQLFNHTLNTWTDIVRIVTVQSLKLFWKYTMGGHNLPGIFYRNTN